MGKTTNSEVWLHFKEKDDYAYCQHCAHRYKIDSSRSTHNMLKHLAKNHADKQLLMKEDLSKIRPDMNKFFTPRSLQPERLRELDDVWALVFSTNNIAFSIVETPSFRSALQAMQPQYTLTKKRLMESICRLDKKIEQEKEKKLAEAERIAITTDVWSSKNSLMSLATYTAHFIKMDGTTKESMLLKTNSLYTSHTSAHLEADLMSTLRQYSLEEKVCAIVSDGAANICKAIHNTGYERVYCANHKLNLVVQKIYKSERLQNILRIFKKTVGLIHRNKVHRQDYLRYCKKFEILEVLPRSECATRWNSLYYLLVDCIRSREALLQFWMNNDEPFVTNEDFAFIAKITALLAPFDSATRTLSCEDSQLGQVLPTFKKLEHQTNLFLAKEDSLSIEVGEFSKGMERHFNEIYSSLLLQFAVLLDPRFSRCAIFTDLAWQEIEVRFEEFYESNAVDENDLILKDGVEEVDEWSCCFENNKKRLKLVGPLQKELIKFETLVKSERPSPSTDVYKWWNDHKEVFKGLYKISCEILSSPATSVSSERVFSFAGIHLNNPRRQRMKDSTAIKLLNITCNQKHVRQNSWPKSKEERYGCRTAYQLYEKQSREYSEQAEESEEYSDEDDVWPSGETTEDDDE